MLPRLSQRTYDLMRRALEAVDKDTPDLITTLVASAFVDGSNDAAKNDGKPGVGQVKQHEQSGWAA